MSRENPDKGSRPVAWEVARNEHLARQAVIESLPWSPLKKAIAHSGNNALLAGELDRLVSLHKLWSFFGF